MEIDVTPTTSQEELNYEDEDKGYYFGSDVDEETLEEAREIIKKALAGHKPDEAILSENDIKYKLDQQLFHWSVVLNVISLVLIMAEVMGFNSPDQSMILMVSPKILPCVMLLQILTVYASVSSFVFNELNHLEPGCSKYLFMNILTVVLYFARIGIENKYADYRGFYYNVEVGAV